MLAILFLVVFSVLVLAFVTLRQIHGAESHCLRLLAGFSQRVETSVEDLTTRFVRIAGSEDVEQFRPLLGNIQHVQGFEPETPDNPGEVPGTPRLEVKIGDSRLFLEYQGRRLKPHEVAQRQDESTAEIVSATGTAAEGSTPDSSDSDSDSGSDASGEPDDEGGEKDQDRRRLRAAIDLEALVAPKVPPGIFDAVLIADGEGRVLYRGGEPELVIADVAELLERGGDLESKAVDRATGKVTAQIAERKFQVFVQPLVLHLQVVRSQPPEVLHLTTYGLVSADRMLSASFASSPILLLSLVSIFPLALLAWPILKLWLISPRQRFTRVDAAFLVSSAVVGLSLLTLFFFALYFHFDLRHTSDRQLEELAHSVHRSFFDELRMIHDQLDEVKDFVSWDRGSSQASESGSQADEDFEKRRRRGKEACREKCPDDFLCFRRYPFFLSLFWIDEDGEPTGNLPLSRYSVNTRSVKDREYFRCAERNQGFRLPAPGEVSPSPDAAKRLCLQSILSNTSGLALAAAVKPIDDGLTEEGRKIVGVALTTELRSITFPALPDDVQLAVVDERGLVHFHSNPTRNLAENLLKASAEDPDLRGVLADRRSALLDVNYLGLDHRLYVRPLGGLPWSLVILRNEQALRHRTFEMVLDFFNPFLLYMGVFHFLLVCVLGIALTTESHRPGGFFDALWPDWEKRESYLLLVGAAPFLLSLFALHVLWPFFGVDAEPLTGKDGIFFISLFIPFASCGVLLQLKYRERRLRLTAFGAEEAGRFAQFRRWFGKQLRRRLSKVPAAEALARSWRRCAKQFRRWFSKISGAGRLARFWRSAEGYLDRFFPQLFTWICVLLWLCAVLLVLLRRYPERLSTLALLSVLLSSGLALFGFFVLDLDRRLSRWLSKQNPSGSWLGFPNHLWAVLAFSLFLALGWFVASPLVGLLIALSMIILFMDRLVLAPYFEGKQRRVAFVFALTSLLFTISVVPMGGFAWLAIDRQREVWVEETQVALARAEEDKMDRHACYRGALADPLWRFGEIVPSCPSPESSPGSPASMPDFRSSDASPQNHRALFDSRVSVVERPSEPPRRRSELWTSNREDPGRAIAGLFSFRLLSYDRVTRQDLPADPLRYRSPERRWVDEGGELTGYIEGQRGARTFRVRSAPAGAARVFDLEPRWTWALLAAVALLLFVSPLAFAVILAEKIMLISLVPFGRPSRGLERILRRLEPALPGYLVTTVPDLALWGLRDSSEIGGMKVERHSLGELATAWNGEYRRKSELDINASRAKELVVSLREERPGKPEKLPVLVITHFWPELEDEHRIHAEIGVLIELLEWGYRMLVVSRSDPRDFETVGRRVNRDGPTLSTCERWASFLSRFAIYYLRERGESEQDQSDEHPAADFYRELKGRKIYLQAMKDEWKVKALGRAEPLFQLVAMECSASTQLRRIGGKVFEELVDPELQAVRQEQCRDASNGETRAVDERVDDEQSEKTRSETAQYEEAPCSKTEGSKVVDLTAPRLLVGHIGHMARAYYHAIWTGCRTDERVALYQLARDGLVNPKKYGVVSDLALKGLVVRDPRLRIMNHSFARFVLNTVDRATLVQWEEEEGTSAWSVFKWLLPLPLLLLGGYLFVTQPSAFSNTIGLVVALGSILPTFHNLFDYFQTISARRELAAARERSSFAA